MFRNNYIAGEQLPADDVNSITDEIINTAHNVLELSLQFYFDGKNVPYDGLFYDGFSDGVKADVLSGTQINTGLRELQQLASGGFYKSIKTEFQQKKQTATLWITRNFNFKLNLAANISAGATSLTITGDYTTKFLVGDTIDISQQINLLRERRVLTGSSFGGGVTTLSWSGGLTNTFTTTGFAERVDVFPRVSLVASGAADSFQVMTYVQSIVDFAEDEVEDEYTFTAGSPQDDFRAKLIFR